MRPRKTWLYDHVRFDRRLSRLDQQVLMTLGQAADAEGRLWRSQPRIAEELGYAARSINRAIKKLETLGYIRIEHRRDARGGNTAAGYVMLPPQAELALDPTDNSVRAPTDRTVGAPPTPGVGAPRTPGVGAIRTTLVERPEKNTTTADAHASAKPPSPRRPAPPPQPELLLPITGGGEARQPTAATTAPPERPPERSSDQRPLAVPERLSERLVAAAGPVLSPTRFADTTFIAMHVPMDWLRSGADFELDILPTIERLSARKPPGSVQSWDYFTRAIAEARDRRRAETAGLPAVQRLGEPPPRRQRGKGNAWAALYREITKGEP